MQFKPATYLIGAQIAALAVGYILRAPDLQATAERQDSIRSEQKEAAFARTEALARAQRCVVLMTELPITDGTAAYFSSVKNGRVTIHKNRPLPSKTTVCDAYGNTGIVAMDAEGNPIVSDIKQMPPEEMEKILAQRQESQNPRHITQFQEK
ncbi:MAG TPA: hypothetical protein V6C85_28650 [Allocoleopsis sp.]